MRFSDGVSIVWEGHPVFLRLKDKGGYKEDIHSAGVQARSIFCTPVYERVSFFSLITNQCQRNSMYNGKIARTQGSFAWLVLLHKFHPLRWA